MDKTKFENSVQFLRDCSVKFYRFYHDKTALVNQLNSISKTGRNTLYNKYKDSSGPIKDIRKEIAIILKERNIELDELESIINQAKSKNENEFNKFFKEWYNILYFFLTIDLKDGIKDSLFYLSDSLINELNSQNIIRSKIVDFKGSRKNGSTACWIALYNKSHSTQETAKQLFLYIENGNLEYSMYNHSTKKHFDKTEINSSEKFSSDNLIIFFKKYLPEIKEDIMSNDKPEVIKLELNQSVYKISMSSRSINNIDYEKLITKNFISVNSNTSAMAGSSQSQGFTYTDQMKIGDYFYLCRGNDHIELLGKITGDIVDSNIENLDLKDGHIQRSFEKIKEPIIKGSYKGKNKWWTPNNNSTCIEIPSNELSLANDLIFQPTFNINFINEKQMDMGTYKSGYSDTKIPLNQILFGPPGTGKTFNTIDKALEIIDHKYYNENQKDRKALKKKFDELKFDLKTGKGQIAFITFHQSMNYEDFIEGIKPLKPEYNNPLSYDIIPGIFKRICHKANDQKGISNFEEVYQNFIDEVIQEDNFELKTPKLEKSFSVQINSNNNCIAIPNTKTATQMVITKNMIYDYLNDGSIRDWKPYVTPIGDYIRKKYDLNAQIGSSDKKEKPFVLIIDEINRGNVSQIFGELITLIEEDKRSGNYSKEALEVILPYSKEKFSVPSNLYIIGTMNTADRSVEALDTALRRRFSFKEMPPIYDNQEIPALNYKIANTPVTDILRTINERIEKLLDKDHQIGHSYFIFKDKDGNDIKDQNLLKEKAMESFNRNIIPLLQEYFFGDFGKIGLVLGKGFVKEKEWDKNSDSFADFDPEFASDFSDRKVYYILYYNSLTEFEDAIKILMGKKEE